METAVTNVFEGLGRRGFVQRLAVGSATLMAGAFKFAPTASAHEEKLTMAAAVAARTHGVRSYLARRSGSGTGTTRLAAELWDGAGLRVGEYVRTERFRTEIDDWVDPADPKGEVQNRVKQFRLSERSQLVWKGHTFQLSVRHADASVIISFDGNEVGTVARDSVRAGDVQAGAPGALAAFVREHREFLTVADAVNADLRVALPPRPVLGCCCQFYCGHMEHSCSEYGNTRSSACGNGESCVNLKCWNSLCAGCCTSSCDAACFVEDFICWAYVVGHSCGCAQYCQ